MSRPTFLTIDLCALQRNLQQVRQFAPHSRVIAMIKANAYGHGIVRIAQALSDADAFGVASLDEAITLREAGIKQPIVLMEGVFYPDELMDAAYYELTLVVHHLPHVEMLEKTPVQTLFSVWLKINTGMHRLGIDPKDCHEVYQRLLKLTNVKKPLGLMTHFAEADHPHDAATKTQIATFTKAIHGLTGPKSLANSAAIIAWPETHADWVRPGLMLFGASPFENNTGLDHGLQPVMTLHSRLIAITKVKRGGKVGYGGTWTAPEDMRVGVVGVGYGDGYPQCAANGTPVLLNNKKCDLVGRVSMDMLTIDLRHQPEAQIGDAVILWGKDLPVEYITKHSFTSPYEILTRMTPRPKVNVLT